MMIATVAPWVLIAALLLDALIGDPDWLWRRLPHPVVGFGWLIKRFDRRWNTPERGAIARRLYGAFATLVLVCIAGAIGWAIVAGLRSALPFWVALVLEAAVAAVFVAQRSLYEHVARVEQAFRSGTLEDARDAVSMIVGRDPKTLDEAGIVRASIETTAENFSDGVTAPAFWFLIAGLPGLMAYKALNTADSMIGHRLPKYADYGWCTARADDVANLIPARLSGVLIVVAACVANFDWRNAWRAMVRDAAKHKSPNAGWPEAAMAGALGIALAGPRNYAGEVVDDAWLNEGGDRSPAPAVIRQALSVFRLACGALICSVGLLAGLLLLLG